MNSSGLHFDHVSHRYKLDGRVLPSVTQVLENVGIIDYDGIPWETRQMALTRGSNVHLATQLDDEGDLDEDSVGDLMGYVKAWRAAKAALGITSFSHIEKRMAHSGFRYAGTMDRMFKGPSGTGEIIDIKTNTAPWWVRIQLAAYQCLAIANNLGAVSVRIAVELHPDGTFNAMMFGEREYRDDLQTFLAALRVMNEKELNRREPKW